jgi:amidase
VPYPSVKDIAASKLLHPLHQQSFDEAVEALPAEHDPATIEGRHNEARFRTAFMQAMDAAGVDALVFPTWAQLPAINGDRNTQLTDDPRPAPHAAPTRLGSSLTFVGSMLQWPAISVPNGDIQGLPTGLQLLARAWDEAKLIQYAYAYEQATHYRQPPSTVPPLAVPASGRVPPACG